MTIQLIDLGIAFVKLFYILTPDTHEAMYHELKSIVNLTNTDKNELSVGVFYNNFTVRGCIMRAHNKEDNTLKCTRWILAAPRYHYHHHHPQTP